MILKDFGEIMKFLSRACGGESQVAPVLVAHALFGQANNRGAAVSAQSVADWMETMRHEEGDPYPYTYLKMVQDELATLRAARSGWALIPPSLDALEASIRAIEAVH